MQQPDREDIWLTNLKFTRQWQAEEVEDVVESKGGSEKYPGPALFPGLAATSKGFAQPDTNNSNPYDRLAADKPGEELTSDSTIWKLYVNEAKEYDEELVLAKNRNLDMMLVFAALFSAILTSFLLDSKNMMQPDAADTSNQLLARIAQRLENPNAPLAPADTSTFSPSSSARWINGLWFTSLVFSLSAALIAMLAKEWLDTFVTSRPRPAHAFALKRQARLDALYSWGALHIIDYLPLFLHIALLMFSLGLVVYLYTAIDTTVATIVALTTGATAFFYVITNLLSVLYEVSPFGTQISLSTRRILRFAANHWSYAQRWKHYFTIKQSKSSDKTTEEDLHALRWLANHAQDPLVGDSAYHALAGFRLGSSPATVDATPDPTIPTSQDEALAKLGRKEKLITNMFVDVCLRLGEATSAGAHELEVSCGASVARYAATLPPLVNYLQPHRNRDLLVKLADARRRQLDAEEEVCEHIIRPSRDLT
ncbi:hypothetical protein FRC08_006176 [Ceratobasidium sp. 394]|nr:hypothetical protein FRC08_006176 [Ceratobasidium sp. 394]